MRTRLATLTLLLACRSSTGVHVTVTKPSATVADQFHVSGVVGGTAAFAPGTLPEPPRTLSDDESFTVLLSDDLGGQRMFLRVDASLAGAAVGSAGAPVDLRAHSVVDLTLALGSVAVCGDGVVVPSLEQCDDGNLRNGDGCNSSCNIEPGFGCSSTSGQPSVCTPDCGSAPPCDTGQRCVSGACVCDSVSCSGCCSGTTCNSGHDNAACGVAGHACEACNTGATCNSGACSDCGATCTAGCCSGNDCLDSALSACGTAGNVCAACDADTADNCGGSGCQCGIGAACAAGQKCSSGSCGCDAQRCPNGCCNGQTCITATNASQCGTGGAVCATCQSGNTCVAGICSGCSATCTGCCNGSMCVTAPAFPTCSNAKTCVSCDATKSNQCDSTGNCACGTNAACSVGEKCMLGTCRCDPASCDGCCDAAGTHCVALAMTGPSECGTGGAICAICSGSPKPCCVSGACAHGTCP